MRSFQIPPSSSLSWFFSDVSGPEFSSTEINEAGREAGLVTDKLLVRTEDWDKRVWTWSCARDNSFRSRSRSSSRSWMISYGIKDSFDFSIFPAQIKLTRRLVKCWFMFLVIAINLWVGGWSLLYNLTEGNSSTASEAKEDSEGTEGSLPAGWPAVGWEATAGGATAAAGERRDVEEATATASSSLNVRLSLTRSDKLLTVKWNFFWDFSSWA